MKKKYLGLSLLALAGCASSDDYLSDARESNREPSKEVYRHSQNTSSSELSPQSYSIHKESPCQKFKIDFDPSMDKQFLITPKDPNDRGFELDFK